MVNVMNALKPDAMTSTGSSRWAPSGVLELVGPAALPGPRRRTSSTPSGTSPRRTSRPTPIFERGGTKIAVIGQAFPYMPIANPGWMFPEYSFGIRDENMQAMVDEVRAAGAEVVVVLSHNGFDVDKKMAGIVHRHRRDPVGPHPRRAARTGAGRRDDHRRLRVERQVRQPRRPRRAGRPDDGLPPQADPDLLGRDRSPTRRSPP